MHLSLSRALTALAGLAAISGAVACGGSSTPNVAADVWATVDDRQIRQADVEKAYRRVAPPQPVTSADEELGGKLSLLDEMITQRVLLKRGRELKIEVTDAEVETAYGERKRNLPDDTFQKQLKDRNLTVEDMKTALRDELTADRVIEREVTAKIAVTDAEVADFYNKNKAQFNVAEAQYRLAQIVVTPVRDPQIRNRKDDDATTPEAAKAKAQMLMGLLKGGTQFSVLAMDYSEDPQSAPNGGDLGFISASQLAQVPQQLREVVMRTEPGNASLVTAGNALHPRPGHRQGSGRAARAQQSERARHDQHEPPRTPRAGPARRVPDHAAQRREDREQLRAASRLRAVEGDGDPAGKHRQIANRRDPNLEIWGIWGFGAFFITLWRLDSRSGARSCDIRSAVKSLSAIATNAFT